MVQLALPSPPSFCGRKNFFHVENQISNNFRYYKKIQKLTPSNATANRIFLWHGHFQVLEPLAPTKYRIWASTNSKISSYVQLVTFYGYFQKCKQWGWDVGE